MRRQRISVGFPFCSLQAISQERQPMHLVILKWKRYCSPGSSGLSGMSIGASGGRAAGADASGLRKSSSVRRTSVSLLPSCARSCSGNAMCGPSLTAGPSNSINVAMVAVLVLQVLDVIDGRFPVQTALLLHNGVQHRVHVFGHVGGVAAYIEAGPFL